MASGAPPGKREKREKEGGKRIMRRKNREGGEEEGGGEKWKSKGRGKRKKRIGVCVYDPLGHQGAYQSAQSDKTGKPKTRAPHRGEIRAQNILIQLCMMQYRK